MGGNQVVASNLARVKEILGGPTEVVVADLPGLEGLQAWADVFRTNQSAEVWRTLGPWILQQGWPVCAPGIKDRLRSASAVPESEVSPSCSYTAPLIHLRG